VEDNGFAFLFGDVLLDFVESFRHRESEESFDLEDQDTASPLCELFGEFFSIRVVDMRGQNPT
jgi:hypothetical protein